MAYRTKRQLSTLHKQARRRRTWPKHESLATKMAKARAKAALKKS